MVDYNELWNIVLTEVELSVSKATYATWFQNTAVGGYYNDVLTICVPNSFTKEWLENKFHKTILKIIRSSCPTIRNVEYVISPNLSKTPLKKQKKEEKESQEFQLKFQEFQIDKQTNLNPRYVFESFVVGPFNELAHAASFNVSKNLGVLYNPLYIYGGVGLGKTHLLQAIGNFTKTHYPNLKIKYITAQNFSDEYIESVINKEIYFFKKKYKNYHLLIIDDVQFLSGKDKTQEELFHVFNTFHSTNRQIVFSSDCPPKSISNLEDRLRSRFEGGMIADISKPEYESRLAILKTKVLKINPQPSNKVLEFIALNITDNIRELEGVLNLVVNRLKLLNKTELPEKDLWEIVNKNKKPQKAVTPNQIIKVISNFYNINEKYLFEKTRRRDIVKPRQIAMYLLREEYSGSYPYIGQKFGGRDHTTAMHAYEKIQSDLKKDNRLCEELKKIKELLYKET
jgi:chromosomal replication initiator protein